MSVEMNKFLPQCLVGVLQLHVSWEELAILFSAKRSQLYLHSSFLSPQQTQMTNHCILPKCGLQNISQDNIPGSH